MQIIEGGGIKYQLQVFRNTSSEPEIIDGSLADQVVRIAAIINSQEPKMGDQELITMAVLCRVRPNGAVHSHVVAYTHRSVAADFTVDLDLKS